MLSDSPLLVFFLSAFGVSRSSFKGRTGTRQSEDCLEHRCQLCMVYRPRGSSSFRQVSRRRGANQVGRGVGRCLACLPVCLAAAVHQEPRGGQISTLKGKFTSTICVVGMAQASARGAAALSDTTTTNMSTTPTPCVAGGCSGPAVGTAAAVATNLFALLARNAFCGIGMCENVEALAGFARCHCT